MKKNIQILCFILLFNLNISSIFAITREEIEEMLKETQKFSQFYTPRFLPYETPPLLPTHPKNAKSLFSELSTIMYKYYYEKLHYYIEYKKIYFSKPQNDETRLKCNSLFLTIYEKDNIKKNKKRFLTNFIDKCILEYTEDTRRWGRINSELNNIDLPINGEIAIDRSSLLPFDQKKTQRSLKENYEKVFEEFQSLRSDEFLYAALSRHQIERYVFELEGLRYGYDLISYWGNPENKKSRKKSIPQSKTLKEKYYTFFMELFSTQNPINFQKFIKAFAYGLRGEVIMSIAKLPYYFELDNHSFYLIPQEINNCRTYIIEQLKTMGATKGTIKKAHNILQFRDT